MLVVCYENEEMPQFLEVTDLFKVIIIQLKKRSTY